MAFEHVADNEDVNRSHDFPLTYQDIDAISSPDELTLFFTDFATDARRLNALSSRVIAVDVEVPTLTILPVEAENRSSLSGCSGRCPKYVQFKRVFDQLTRV